MDAENSVTVMGSSTCGGVRLDPRGNLLSKYPNRGGGDSGVIWIGIAWGRKIQWVYWTALTRIEAYDIWSGASGLWC